MSKEFLELRAKVRRRRKTPSVGSYVLASRWSDIDPMDPWHVGILWKVELTLRTTSRTWYYVEGSSRRWGYAKEITEDEAREIVRAINEKGENDGLS
jgi:hypothetical protein